MRRPRLVATDLDGTLLRSDGMVSARTTDVLARLDGTDVEFVIVTARPPRWMHDLRGLVGPHGIALCSNGAFAYDVANQEIITAHTMDAAAVRTIAADLRVALPGIVFAVERHDGFGRETRYGEPHPEPPGTPVAALEELLESMPGKLLARLPGMDPVAFLDEVEQVIGDRAVLAFSGVDGLAEISGPGVTKAAALATWCGERGIDARDVWAFGDMPNDLSMLAYAGCSFAVANAHPTVLAAVDEVVEGNDSDGVASRLEALLA